MAAENWSKLTPEEKYEARFKEFIAGEHIPFANDEVKAAYQLRAQMIKDVVDLKKPDHVPVAPNIGFYPAVYAGITAEEAMYDYEKLGMAWKKYHQDFQPEYLTGCGLIGPGKLFETLDYKLYNWPGHGCDPKSPYQCVEDKYMLDDEYDELITDPSGYWMRKYMPRIFGALQPWSQLSPFTDIVELPFVGAVMIPVGLPDVQESFQKYLEAGRLALEWVSASGAIDAENAGGMGLPNIMGGFSKAPFDTIGDTMRGTKSIMLDMYRRPEKLIKAADALVPIMVEMGVRTATVNKNPMVFIPLHKGADGFLSREDFARFYWPSLKAVMLGLINEGLVPYLFVEGGYDQRLDFLADPELPTGKVFYVFDYSDMRKVKETLGGRFSFGGNVPVSMLATGTPDDVKTYVKNLIEDVAGDGGFLLSTGAVTDLAKPENLHALFEAGKAYGQYR